MTEAFDITPSKTILIVGTNTLQNLLITAEFEQRAAFLARPIRDRHSQSPLPHPKGGGFCSNLNPGLGCAQNSQISLK